MARGHVALALLFVTAAVAGVGAMAVRPPGAASFTLPPEAALLPAKASFVAGVDVQRLVSSQAYQRFRREAPTGVDVWAEMERRTGVRAERDVTTLVTASDPAGSGLTVVLGRFDRAKVEEALSAKSGLATREHGKRRIWAAETQVGGKETAVSIVDDGLLLMGPVREIEAGLERRDTKTAGLTSNSALLALASRIEPGSTFWMCGDQGALSAAGNLAPQAAGWTIPSVKTLVVSGALDPDVRASIVAEAADEPSARNVADMLRAVISMIAVQGGQRPELKELTSGIQVSQQGAEVRIAARVAHDTLARLQAPPRPKPRPSPRAEPEAEAAPPRPAKK